MDMRSQIPTYTHDEEQLSPNYQHFIHALRSVGYSFEESVADIIDNSIDAAATHISIRFVIRENTSVDLLISDNGEGMDEGGVRQAMIFGTQPIEARQQRLGKFGLGLKMASIAQAMDFHVVSLKNRELSGRSWTDEGLKKGFFCARLARNQIDRITAFDRTPLREGHGTWVYLEFLHRHASAFHKAEQLCEKLALDLQNHLGLHLHRFLKRTKITIEICDYKGMSGALREVRPYDPFGYPTSGCAGYPSEYLISGEYAGKLTIKAHIWPAKSSSPNYKLPGGAIKRQGLYFYRHDRLICGGGWYDIKEGLDSHDSLGRAEINLLGDTELEREVSLDVRKALVKVTPSLREAILSSQNSAADPFKKFLKDSNSTYRAAGGSGGDEVAGTVIVPVGADFPAELREKIIEIQGRGQSVTTWDFHFKWEMFDPDDADLFFRLIPAKNLCLLNKVYQARVEPGTCNNKDLGKAVLLKTTLFFLLEDCLGREQISPKEEHRLEGLSKIMASAVKSDNAFIP